MPVWCIDPVWLFVLLTLGIWLGIWVEGVVAPVALSGQTRWWQRATANVALYVVIAATAVSLGILVWKAGILLGIAN